MLHKCKEIKNNNFTLLPVCSTPTTFGFASFVLNKLLPILLVTVSAARDM